MNKFLPTNMTEARSRGWKQLDVILISGDAYVDHPSFGVALVGRHLESLGVKVGVIAAPNINNPEEFTALGKPKWFFGVTSGNLDSMLMHMTASKKRRNNDDYVPENFSAIRPRRAVIAYCNKLRELYDRPPILIGGIEASLRRFAHYDYWDNKIRRSILFDARADMLVYGMAENPLNEIIQSMKKGKRLDQIRNIKGTSIILNKKESEELRASSLEIHSFDQLLVSKKKYSNASKIINNNLSPYNAKTILQSYGNRYLCVYPPSMPLAEKKLDSLYDLPFTRLPHSKYKEKIAAYEMIKFSITALRGCFGGCSFCSLSAHQGKEVQSRSTESILKEVRNVTKMKDFTGHISDIGGPTANMYKMYCNDNKIKSVCKKLSCIYPGICKYLKTDHTDLIKMLQRVRKEKNIKKVFVASGVRFDIANLSREYIRELARYHVSGQLKVAPEHCDSKVLHLMKKNPFSDFEKFKERFLEESKRAGLKQFLVPYFMSSHPGCTKTEQISLYEYLKKNNLRPRQVQEFMPIPLTLAADMYYTGVDSMTGKHVSVERSEKERKVQRALLLYYKPENAHLVRRAKSI